MSFENDPHTRTHTHTHIYIHFLFSVQSGTRSKSQSFGETAQQLTRYSLSVSRWSTSAWENLVILRISSSEEWWGANHKIQFFFLIWISKVFCWCISKNLIFKFRLLVIQIVDQPLLMIDWSRLWSVFALSLQTITEHNDLSNNWLFFCLLLV